MNRKIFYDKIRASLFHGILSESKVDSIEAILHECEINDITDYREMAYIFATIFHETAGTMQPIEEYGKGAGHAYGKKIKQDRSTYLAPPKIFYGRGFVQLTWYENYERMGKHLGVDLLNHPELALQLDIASRIIIEGMTKGMFTGRKLSDYFNDETTDYIKARTIINGNDCAEKIAGYANKFFTALY